MFLLVGDYGLPCNTSCLLIYFLCCQMHITAVFSILLLNQCFQNSSLHFPSTSWTSHPLSTTTRSSTYSILPILPLKLTFLLTSCITMINMSWLRAFPCLKLMFQPQKATASQKWKKRMPGVSVSCENQGPTTSDVAFMLWLCSRNTRKAVSPISRTSGWKTLHGWRALL